MAKSISLEIRHPEQADGRIEGFKFFWAYYVKGFRRDKHCQECFIGEGVPEFNSNTVAVGKVVTLDRMDEFKYVYVCGVGTGERSELYRRNFHLPLRYEEGCTVSAETWNGYIVTATNAVLLQVPALKPGQVQDASEGDLGPEFTRCRNFQFGMEYFVARSG